ncbi:MAG: hypothetical protein ACF8Q5_00265 [Phycisphaerales bacterium JB040]
MRRFGPHLATLFAVLGLLASCAQSPSSPADPATAGQAENGAPSQSAFEQPRQSLMTAGSLEDTFEGVATVAFAGTPHRNDSHSDPAKDPETVPEHDAIDASIRAAVRTRFTQAGYRWLDEGEPQRTVQIGFLLTPSLSLDDLDALYRLAPGFLSPESAERGVVALAISWPGRAEPVCRLLLDGVESPDAPLEDRLSAIEPAVRALLAELPPGPGPLIDSVTESVTESVNGPVAEAGTDPGEDTPHE